MITMERLPRRCRLVGIEGAWRGDDRSTNGKAALALDRDGLGLGCIGRDDTLDRSESGRQHEGRRVVTP
jgi:hypothetical protein